MKRNFLILILLCFSTIQLNAKNILPVDSIKAHSIKLATSDLKKNEGKFLIRGGIVSIRKKGQEIFEKKYAIRYMDLGCVAPSDISVEEYNKIVAVYLDKKFGKTWRKEVRNDVSGI